MGAVAASRRISQQGDSLLVKFSRLPQRISRSVLGHHADILHGVDVLRPFEFCFRCSQDFLVRFMHERVDVSTRYCGARVQQHQARLDLR